MSEKRHGSLFDVLASQRLFIYLAVTLLSVAGIWSARTLPSAIYPELSFPRITIVAQGASLGARQVVFAVSRPIEEAVSIVPGVTRVQSKSIRGSSEVNVTFADGTDMNNAVQLVRTRVEEIRGDLPAGLSIEIERLTPSLFPILSYNLEGGDPATLYDIARYQIKPVLSRVPGVGRVDVQGSDTREIEVVADPARLSNAGLTYDDVATAIKSNVTSDAVGRVAQDYKQYLVVSAEEAHSIDDVANVVVRPGIRVRDVATVTPGTEDHLRVISGNGHPAALLNITRQIGGNTVAIADSVARAVETISKTLPTGVRLTAVYDQAALVRDAVTSVRDAMLIGAGLAVIILLLFLQHFRITAISAAAIPLTLAITVLVMRMFGQTFNLMTLGAMAIAIGLVIDDAVVITENIVRHLALTSNRTMAIREAVQELILPVTSSTATTVVVFIPLGLLQGVTGQFFAALSLTLTASVLVSLVLALSIIPLLSEQFLNAHDAETASIENRSVLARAGRALDALSVHYSNALGSVLHHLSWVVFAALLLVVGGVFAYRGAGSGFLPEMDEGAFIVDIVTPGGTALAETDRQVHIIEEILAHTPEVEGTSRRTGAELGLFATEQNKSDISVRLKPQSQRDRRIEEIIDEVRGKVEAAVPRARVEFPQLLSDVLDDLSGASSPMEIKLYGADLAQLDAYAQKLEPKVSKVEGLADYFSGIPESSAEMSMHVNAGEASRLGLTSSAISSSVSSALLGVSAGEIRLDDRSIGVRVRAPDSLRFNAQRLSALPIASPTTNRSAPLGALATFTTEDVRSEHLRENQQQTVVITAAVEGRPLSEVIGDIKTILAENPPPTGIRLELGGRYAGQQEAFMQALAEELQSQQKELTAGNRRLED
ncbi:MAG: efflux RND transporter permease subunit, partial [Gemmatimonadaceae bacterium]